MYSQTNLTNHFCFIGLVDFYPEDHEDRSDCQAALDNISQTSEILRETLPNSENYELLFELQRDLSGFDKLVQSDRVLIRQGCLLKHSKKGLQQRMFFLVIRQTKKYFYEMLKRRIFFFSFPMYFCMETNRQ